LKLADARLGEPVGAAFPGSSLIRRISWSAARKGVGGVSEAGGAPKDEERKEGVQENVDVSVREESGEGSLPPRLTDLPTTWMRTRGVWRR